MPLETNPLTTAARITAVRQRIAEALAEVNAIAADIASDSTTDTLVRQLFTAGYVKDAGSCLSAATEYLDTAHRRVRVIKHTK